MKNILYIHHGKGWGGAPSSMIKIILSLNPAEYSTEVLLLKDSIVSKVLAENGIRYSVAQSWFYRYLYKYYSHTEIGYIKWYQIITILYLSLSWALSRFVFAPRILKDFNVDIIHLNSSVLTDWLAPCRSVSRVVMHVREPFSNGSFGVRAHFFRMQMEKYADSIITISFDNARRLGLEGKTKVVYNYTELSHVEPKSGSYSSKKILYAGGAAYIKGFHILVDSLEYLNQDIRVLFLGNFPMSADKNFVIRFIQKIFYPRSYIRDKAIKKMSVSPNAIKIGLVGDIKTYLDEVCCLVSPFIIPHFSRPIIEAYANYKPVIASNIQGMNEIVENGKTGILVNPDPMELAEAINYITDHPEESIKMGEKGYKFVSDKFTPANIKRFTEIYDSLVAG